MLFYQNPPVHEPKNSSCCLKFFNCLYIVKQSLVVVISTTCGLVFLIGGLSNFLVLVPLNFVLTYRTQLWNLDLLLCISMWIMSLIDILQGLQLVSMTSKQRVLWSYVFCCCWCQKKQERGELYSVKEGRLKRRTDEENRPRMGAGDSDDNLESFRNLNEVDRKKWVAAKVKI